MLSRNASSAITAIERTAYPQFKHNPSAKELAELYTPTPEEIKFASSRVKSKNGLLGLMVMLKSFQRLGYFPHPELVPTAIIAHLRKRLNLSSSVSAIPSVRSIRYYQQAIRAYLGVKPYDKKAQLKTGDACVVGSENYADFREQLLSWEECASLVEQYCLELGIPSTADAFVEYLKAQLTQQAREVDQICSQKDQVTISSDGEPVLKRIPAVQKPDGAAQLETAILQQMPERSLLDILCNVEHWLNWTRHFGPVSGSEPKFSQAQERYILTAFGYGCNLIAGAVILHNAVDLTLAIQTLNTNGYKVNRALLATLSPYITRHIKRYGDYMVDLSRVPPPWEGAIPLPIEIPET